MKLQPRRLLLAGLGLAGLLTISDSLHAQPIYVPNHSFNSPSAPMAEPYVTTLVNSWQKPAQPAYFDFVEATYGIFWDQTTGIFFGPGAYGNMDGSQAAFVMAWPEAGLFQDHSTTPEFDATFEIGKSYHLTVGVYGKGYPGYPPMTEGTQLGLSLYYRDGADLVTVGAPTLISYSTALFPGAGALNLIDFSVVIPTVQAGDDWAGKDIGIKIASVSGIGDGYWDIDNVRLTAVPEPSTLAVAALGGLLALRFRRRS